MSKRLREEALATPFICLTAKGQPISAWKRRVLLDGYCRLLTYKNKELSRCRYCHVDLPYDCCFRDKKADILFEKLFTNKYQERPLREL